MRSSITIRLRPAGISNAEKKRRGRLHQIKRRERKEENGGNKGRNKGETNVQWHFPKVHRFFSALFGCMHCTVLACIACTAVLFFSVLFSGFVNVANSVVIQVQIRTSLITVWN
jgi:hypothetical protein